MVSIIGPEPGAVSHENILDFFKLRHRSFVQELGWHIPARNGYETDQYDFPHARFLLAYEEGECVGGLRIAPTHSRYLGPEGQPVTFMLRDFVDGTIQTPFKASDLTRDLPEGKASWEMTRFVSNGRRTTQQLLFRADDYLAGRGVENVLTLSPTTFVRLLQAMGFQAEPISDTVTFEDGREYVAICTQVGRSSGRRRSRTAA